MAYTHEYRREYGSYAFYSDGKLLFRTPNVSVLFDQDCGTLLKHGVPADVQRIFKEYMDDMPMGMGVMIDLTVVEFPPDYPAADITAMINTSGRLLDHIDRAVKGMYTPESGT